MRIVQVGIVCGIFAVGTQVNAEEKNKEKKTVTATVQTTSSEPVITFRKTQNPVSQNAKGARLEIDRIGGCTGELEKARDTILPASGTVAEQQYHLDRFTSPVLHERLATDSVCVVDDQPGGIVDFFPYVESFDDYMFNLFECGCGSCFLESGEEFTEEDVEQYITKAHRKEYKQYVKKQTKIVEAQRAIHEEYVATYQQWQKNKEARLEKPAIRVAVTATTDIPAGSIELYQYKWEQYSWCGDVGSGSRNELKRYPVQHPSVAAGETLEIWVEHVETSLEWGALMSNDGVEQRERDFQLIIEEANLRSQLFKEPLRGLPEQLSDRAIETTLGQMAIIADDCCSC